MWLFRKKKKEEEVKIEEPVEDTEPTLEEEKQEEKPPVDINEVRGSCTNLLHLVDRQINDIKKDYYLQKVFSLGCIKTDAGIIEFRELSIAVENSFDRLNEISSDYNKNINSNDEEVLLKLQNDLTEFNTKLNSNKVKLVETRNKYFSKLLISSVSPFMNKNNTELELLTNKILRFLADYKNLDDAADRVYLDSGEIVVKTIKALVKYASTCKDDVIKNKFKYEYFLDGEVILAMSTGEWINLYNKITYCLKRTVNGQVSSMVAFLKLFNEFELRYIVLMIQKEGKRV